jgi:hypothetical protein
MVRKNKYLIIICYYLLMSNILTAAGLNIVIAQQAAAAANGAVLTGVKKSLSQEYLNQNRDELMEQLKEGLAAATFSFQLRDDDIKLNESKNPIISKAQDRAFGDVVTTPKSGNVAAKVEILDELHDNSGLHAAVMKINGKIVLSVSGGNTNDIRGIADYDDKNSALSGELPSQLEPLLKYIDTVQQKHEKIDVIVGHSIGAYTASLAYAVKNGAEDNNLEGTKLVLFNSTGIQQNTTNLLAEKYSIDQNEVTNLFNNNNNNVISFIGQPDIWTNTGVQMGQTFVLNPTEPAETSTYLTHSVNDMYNLLGNNSKDLNLTPYNHLEVPAIVEPTKLELPAKTEENIVQPSR